MLRTTCLGAMSLLVSTCTSLTSPNGVTTTRADSTPVRPVVRLSTRLMPHGSVCPVPSGQGSCAVTWFAPPPHRWRLDCVPRPSHDTMRGPPRPPPPHPPFLPAPRRPPY